MRLWATDQRQGRFKPTFPNWQESSKAHSLLSQLKGAKLLNFLGQVMSHIWLPRNVWDLAANPLARFIRGDYFECIPNHISSTILREILARTQDRFSITS